MKSLILSRFDMTYLPIIACLIFVTFFILMLIWINRPASKKMYQEAEVLPLELGDNNE